MYSCHCVPLDHLRATATEKMLTDRNFSFCFFRFQVEYSLAVEDRENFSINPTDGTLSVTRALDRESRSSYVIHVTARDKGSPSNSTVQEVKVTVGDANDHTPVFDPRTYSKTIRLVLQATEILLQAFFFFGKSTVSLFFPLPKNKMLKMGRKLQFYRLPQVLPVLDTKDRHHHFNSAKQVISTREEG